MNNNIEDSNIQDQDIQDQDIQDQDIQDQDIQDQDIQDQDNLDEDYLEEDYPDSNANLELDIRTVLNDLLHSSTFQQNYDVSNIDMFPILISSRILSRRSAMGFRYNNNDIVNSFINGTLNQKSAYKNVTSDEGFLQIEKITYDNSLEVNNSCPIFCVPFSEGEIISKLPCNHCYNSEALEKWLQESNLCPVCRYELKSKEVKVENENVTGSFTGDSTEGVTGGYTDTSGAVNGDNQNINNFSLFTFPGYNYSNYSNYSNMLIQQEELDYQEAILQSLRN